MKTTSASSQLIDEKVIITMIICSVLAIIVLAFRYKSYEPYSPVNILVQDGTLYTAELIQFKADGTDLKGKRLQWSFGDSSNEHDEGVTANHQFINSGRFDITLTINGNHKEHKTILIVKGDPISVPVSTPQFTGPQKAIVGETVTFKDSTSNATQWEWWFGEKISATPDATGRVVKYAFKEPGNKTVTLVVNGNITGSLSVFVNKKQVKQSTDKEDQPFVIPDVKGKPTPPPLPNPTPIDSSKAAPEATKPAKALDVSEDQLAVLLKKVVDGDKSAADFSQYFADGSLNTTVYSNGKGMPFKSFCEELKAIKKSRNLKTFKVVGIDKDANNYIKSLNVNYEKYGLIGRTLH
jgi:PKD repeat protein